VLFRRQQKRTQDQRALQPISAARYSDYGGDRAVELVNEINRMLSEKKERLKRQPREQQPQAKDTAP
jgi:hypothetical protein